MKTKLAILLLCFAVVSCAKKKTVKVKDADVLPLPSAPAVAEEPQKPLPPAAYFDLIKDFPIINDSTAFINALKTNRQLKNFSDHKILAYKKIAICGAEKPVVMVVYDEDFNNDKYQLVLFTENGKYLKTLTSYDYGFLKVLSNEKPLFVNTEVTNQGNGGRSFYKIEGDSLVNVAPYEFVNTFDRHQDNAVFEPEGLKMSVADDNHDGYNDIIFKGKVVLIQRKIGDDWVDGVSSKGKNISYSMAHPYKIAPIKFVLQYEPNTGTFVSKEDYRKKYRDYYY